VIVAVAGAPLKRTIGDVGYNIFLIWVVLMSLAFQATSAVAALLLAGVVGVCAYAALRAHYLRGDLT